MSFCTWMAVNWRPRLYSRRSDKLITTVCASLCFLISFLSPWILFFFLFFLSLLFPEEEDTLVSGKSPKPPAAPPSASGLRATRVNTKIVVYGPQDSSSPHSQGPLWCTVSLTSICLLACPFSFLIINVWGLCRYFILCFDCFPHFMTMQSGKCVYACVCTCMSVWTDRTWTFCTFHYFFVLKVAGKLKRNPPIPVNGWNAIIFRNYFRDSELISKFVSLHECWTEQKKFNSLRISQ